MANLRMADEYDRLLLREELRRMEQRGFVVNGDTEQGRLGADAWVLGVAVVDDKTRPQKPKRS